MLPSSSSSSRARSRSWSWGAAPPLSPRQLKPQPHHERSSSSTYPPPVVSDSEGQQGRDAAGDNNSSVQDLEEGFRPATTEAEESARAQQEPTTEHGMGDGGAAAKERVRHLEREVSSAKQMEMKMLESLVQQTKELEQAKIALEEARLELAALRHQLGQAQAGAEPAAQPQSQWSVMDLVFGGVDEEINGLRDRLRAAMHAEERSRKAADELAVALSAVSMEAKQVKAWLADAQAESEAATAEAERLKGLLQGAEAELWAATDQVDALTSQWKEAAAGWRAREKALLARARAAEDDAAAARRECAELAAELDRAAEEAGAAGEALELARAENAGLLEANAEKDRDLEALRRENESLGASEAAARDRAKELEAQLAAATATATATGTAAELPLVEKWRREAAQGKLGAAAFLESGRVIPGRKDRMFASLSNLAELKSAAAAAAMDDFDYEFDHFDVMGPYGDAGEHAMKHKKRRSILRKFGDLFRRRSMYKRNLAPVLHNHY